MRTYSELSKLDTLDERFDYLVLGDDVGHPTFGFNRWLNQHFYKSSEWRVARSFVIAREEGYDMGLADFPLNGAPHVHHMNPLTLEDIEYGTDNLFNPEYLVAVSLRTHNAIHFGDRSHLPSEPVVRAAGDTRLW